MVGRDKGKQGIVSNIIPERNWVFVEDLNMVRLTFKSNKFVTFRAANLRNEKSINSFISFLLFLIASTLPFETPRYTCRYSFEGISSDVKPYIHV